MSEEEWRNIGDGPYQASSLGRIRNGRCSRKREQLTQRRTPAGYMVVSLWKGSAPKQERVHRLVWQAFNGPIPSDRPQINHRDGDKLNNRPENLECVTPQENMVHASRNGLLKRSITADVVALIRSEALSLTRADLAKKYGICMHMVGRLTRDIPGRKRVQRVDVAAQRRGMKEEFDQGVSARQIALKWGVSVWRVWQVVRPGVPRKQKAINAAA